MIRNSHFQLTNWSIGWHVVFLWNVCVFCKTFLCVCGLVFFFSISFEVCIDRIDEIKLENFGKFGICLTWVYGGIGDTFNAYSNFFLYIFIARENFQGKNHLWWKYYAIGIVWWKLNAIITVPISIGVMLVLLFGFGEGLLQKRTNAQINHLISKYVQIGNFYNEQQRGEQTLEECEKL